MAFRLLRWLSVLKICLILAGLTPGYVQAAPDVVPGNNRDAPTVEHDPCRNGALNAWMLARDYGDEDGNPITPSPAACKPLPDTPNSAVIAVFKLRDGHAKPETGTIEYDFHLALVDEHGKLLAQYREPKAFQSDDQRLEKVRIDTGRYRLATGIRAFGIVAGNNMACRGCIDSTESLTLYVREGMALRPVLSGLAISADAAEPGKTAEGCVGAYRETRRTLALGQARHAGFVDLSVTTIVRHRGGSKEGDVSECPATADDERTREIWVYDGQKYRPTAGGT